MVQSSLVHSSRSIPYSQHFNWNLVCFTSYHILHAKPSSQLQRRLFIVQWLSQNLRSN